MVWWLRPLHYEYICLKLMWSYKKKLNKNMFCPVSKESLYYYLFF